MERACKTQMDTLSAKFGKRSVGPNYDKGTRKYEDHYRSPIMQYAGFQISAIHKQADEA